MISPDTTVIMRALSWVFGSLYLGIIQWDGGVVHHAEPEKQPRFGEDPSRLSDGGSLGWSPYALSPS